MSREERFGTRSPVYSRWHRYALPDSHGMIDLDGVEYCRTCNRTILLVEVARDVGQAIKPATVLRNLANDANVMAIVLLYTPDPDVDQATGCGCQSSRLTVSGCTHGILSFRLQRIDQRATSRAWQFFTVGQYVAALEEIRRLHSLDHRAFTGGDAA